MHDPRESLKTFGLSEAEANTYLAMLGGASTAREVIAVTRQRRPTVYYTLRRLEELGFIARTGRSGGQRFTVMAPQRLQTIAERRAKEFSQAATQMAEFIQSAGTGKPTEKPQVTFYEGRDAIMNLIMETLYCRDGRLLAVAPNDNFFWHVGRTFVEQFVRERAARNVFTRSLWEKTIDQKDYEHYYNTLADIRILPATMHGKFATTLIIYDDKTLAISSGAQSYCLLMQSAEYHDTMQAIFEGLWEASRPYPITKDKQKS